TVGGAVSGSGTLTDTSTATAETIDIGGDISGIDMDFSSGNPTVQAAQTFNPSSLLSGDSTIELDSGNAASLAGLSYNNLIFNKSTGAEVITSIGSLTVTNLLTMISGDWTAGAAVYTHDIDGGWDSTAVNFTFTPGSSTIWMNSGSVNHVTGEGFYNFTANGTITLASALEVSNDLSVPNTGSLTSANYAMDVDGNLSLTSSAASTLAITGTGTLTVDGTSTIDSGSTLSLGDGAATFGNDTTDTFTNSGTLTSTGTGNVTFYGNYDGSATTAVLNGNSNAADDLTWTFREDATIYSIDTNGDSVWFDSDVTYTHTLTINGTVSFDTVVVSTDHTVNLDASSTDTFIAATLQTGDTGSDNDTAVFDATTADFNITTLSNGGRFRLEGSQTTQTIGTNDSDSGWTEYYDGTETLDNADFDTLWNLEISSGTYTLGQDLTILGTGNDHDSDLNDYNDEGFFLSGGTFNAGSNTITISEAFSDTGGTFNCDTSHIILTGSNDGYIGGTNTFYQLSCNYVANASDPTVSADTSVSGKDIYFLPNETITIDASGFLALSGDPTTAPTNIPLTDSYETSTTYLCLRPTDDPADTSSPDSDEYWILELTPGADVFMENLCVWYSDASTYPLVTQDNVYVYQCPGWMDYVRVLSSRTLDTDDNGKIDQIEVEVEVGIIQEADVDEYPFADFTVTVTGYNVTGYLDGSIDDSTDYFYFRIELEELSYLDTDATPEWQIQENTSLVDDAAGDKLVLIPPTSGTPSEPYYGLSSPTDTPDDEAAPVIGYTLAVPGNSEMFVHFSEPVEDNGGNDPTQDDFDYTGLSVSANGFTTVTAGDSGGVKEALISFDGDLTHDDILDGTIATQTATPLQDLASTVNTMDTSLSRNISHVLSDVLFGPADNGPVEPLWARDETTSSTSGSGSGVINDFDGTAHLKDEDITLQAHLHSDIDYADLGGSNIELRFVQEPGSTYVNDYGLWLDSEYFAETTFSGLVPYALSSTGITSYDGTAESSNDHVWNFSLLEDDISNNEDLEFLFYLPGIGRYSARIDDETASDWYRRVYPWSFGVHDIVNQGGGVSILNNIINPNLGEEATLYYSLSKGGMISVQVFDLAGGLVEILHRGRQEAGDYSLSWNGTNRANNTVARGIYFIRLVGPDVDEMRKVMVIK
ncbi:MAG: FlgD immunoglobulin-like domain containing protein, partial [Spirochaetales bacterium]|nr:FlgD immunoglobulin-like domain containing protein [Spirochaetales bacterium]